MRDQILVLNYDSRYAASIASKLRAEKIYCKILPGNATVERVMSEEALGLILAGGLSGQMPGELDGQLLRAGMPVLALGDAASAVAALLGAPVAESVLINEVETVSFLPSRITQEEEMQSDRLLGVVRPFTLTDDLAALAQFEETVIGVAHKTLDIFALQTQLEPNDPDMMGVILRFAQQVCGATPWWSEDAFIKNAKADILEAAGAGQAVCLMSGGMESGVTAMLAHRALGDRLRCIFVDTGLLREGETEDFLTYYQSQGLNITVVKAEDKVLSALSGLLQPWDKQQAIFDCLQKVIDQACSGLSFDLVIDTSSASTLLSAKAASPILPHVISEFPSIAPVQELFRDEIRLVGEALGMPHEVTRMQPFPWTGLALRIIGECTKEKLTLLRTADAIFQEELRLAGQQKRLWKYFAMLHSIPYQEDPEAPVIALRAVSASHQGGDVRALPARLPYDLLERCTERILTECQKVSKIVYDLTPGQNLQQIEWH